MSENTTTQEFIESLRQTLWLLGDVLYERFGTVVEWWQADAERNQRIVVAAVLIIIVLVIGRIANSRYIRWQRKKEWDGKFEKVKNEADQARIYRGWLGKKTLGSAEDKKKQVERNVSVNNVKVQPLKDDN